MEERKLYRSSTQLRWYVTRKSVSKWSPGQSNSEREKGRSKDFIKSDGGPNKTAVVSTFLYKSSVCFTLCIAQGKKLTFLM